MSPTKHMTQNNLPTQVLDCVIPYIHDGDTRNSVSLVSRKGYEVDSLTRKNLTVHVHYAPNPSSVSARFPNIESLTLKGFSSKTGCMSIHVTPWIKEIAVEFKRLHALVISDMIVYDSDLEILARTRGDGLRVLEICECKGFWDDGIMHVSKYCTQLKSLCLVHNHYTEDVTNVEPGNWLRELALRNKVMESLHFMSPFNVYEIEDLTLLAKNCCDSLVSLRIPPCSLGEIAEAFRHAVKLEYFNLPYYDGEFEDYVGYKFPPNMHSFGVLDLPATSWTLLLPLASKLRELNLHYIESEQSCGCDLIKNCPNLEVLETWDICGDSGFHVIGQFCKKLRKLTHKCSATHEELTALVLGCHDLEHLDVQLFDITNEALECVGNHLKNLRHFRMNLVDKDGITHLPLDNGIRAMLKGCTKLERLDISLCHGGLGDRGLKFVGRYGRNLVYLSLVHVGESDAGLVELSKGCPKLRELKLTGFPFSEQSLATCMSNIDSLRYLWVRDLETQTTLVMTRPDFEL